MLLLTVHIPLKTHTPDFRMSISLFEGPRDSPACSSDNSSIKMKMKISITDIYLNYINSLRNARGTNSFSTTKINQSVLMYVRTYTWRHSYIHIYVPQHTTNRITRHHKTLFVSDRIPFKKIRTVYRQKLRGSYRKSWATSHSWQLCNIKPLSIAW